MAMRGYTRWGTVVGTGAASIDIVLMEATRPLTIREIEDEIRHRGLPERGAVSSHLNTLKGRGHIINTPDGWCRVEMVPGYSAPSPAPPARSTPAPSPPSEPPPLPLPPAPRTTRTEKLQGIKLMLEIGVVALALIGGIIALIWKNK